jgi:hypothetical protein
MALTSCLVTREEEWGREEGKRWGWVTTENERWLQSRDAHLFKTEGR